MQTHADPEPQPTVDVQPDHGTRAEPQVGEGWAGSDDSFPHDPPMHAPETVADDSPFAEPEDQPNQIVR